MQNAIKTSARNLSGRHAPFLLPISDILPPSVFILPSGSCLLQSSLLPGMKTIKAFIHFLHPPSTQPPEPPHPPPKPPNPPELPSPQMPTRSDPIIERTTKGKAQSSLCQKHPSRWTVDEPNIYGGRACWKICLFNQCTTWCTSMGWTWSLVACININGVVMNSILLLQNILQSGYWPWHGMNAIITMHWNSQQCRNCMWRCCIMFHAICSCSGNCTRGQSCFDRVGPSAKTGTAARVIWGENQLALEMDGEALQLPVIEEL